jgi:DNA-directed RNA polymerase specialized sigma24 family protein
MSEFGNSLGLVDASQVAGSAVMSPENERKELEGIYQDWREIGYVWQENAQHEAEPNQPSLGNMLEEAQLSANDQELLEGVSGYLALIALDAEAVRPRAVFEQAQAAVAQTIPELDPTLDDDLILDKIIDTAMEGSQKHGTAQQAAPAPHAVRPVNTTERLLPRQGSEKVVALKPYKLVRDMREIDRITSQPSQNTNVKDFKGWSGSIDTVALFLKDALSVSSEDKTRHLGLARAFDTSFVWLDASLQRITNKIISNYTSNGRLNSEDMQQVMRQQMIESLIPSFDPAIGSFIGFYRAHAWTRLQEYVGKNASQLSTPAQFIRRTKGDDRDRALAATSYDRPIAVHSANTAYEDEWTPELLPLNGKVDIDMVDEISQRALLGTIMDTIGHRLSALERAAIIETGIQGETYEACAAKHGMKFKTVDNALQRAMRKLNAALQDQGQTIEG